MLRIDVLDHREPEGRGLARARLRLADDVAPLEQRRDALLLDRATASRTQRPRVPAGRGRRGRARRKWSSPMAHWDAGASRPTTRRRTCEERADRSRRPRGRRCPSLHERARVEPGRPALAQRLDEVRLQPARQDGRAALARVGDQSPRATASVSRSRAATAARGGSAKSTTATGRPPSGRRVRELAHPDRRRRRRSSRPKGQLSASQSRCLGRPGPPQSRRARRRPSAPPFARRRRSVSPSAGTSIVTAAPSVERRARASRPRRGRDHAARRGTQRELKAQRAGRRAAAEDATTRLVAARDVACCGAAGARRSALERQRQRGCRRRPRRERHDVRRRRERALGVAAATAGQRDDALAGVRAAPGDSDAGARAAGRPRRGTRSRAGACRRSSRRRARPRSGPRRRPGRCWGIDAARAPPGPPNTVLLDRSHGAPESVQAPGSGVHSPRRRMSLTVVGRSPSTPSRPPFRGRERMLGGAATHFALAASFFDEVRAIGVGRRRLRRAVARGRRPRATRGTITDDIERVEGAKTFFWARRVPRRAQHARDASTTTLNVFETFKPGLRSRAAHRRRPVPARTSSPTSSARCASSARDGALRRDGLMVLWRKSRRRARRDDPRPSTACRQRREDRAARRASRTSSRPRDEVLTWGPTRRSSPSRASTAPPVHREATSRCPPPARGKSSTQPGPATSLRRRLRRRSPPSRD